MASRSFAPLRLTWRLSQPLQLGPFGIHLDSLVASRLFAREISGFDQAHAALPLGEVFDRWYASTALPLARTEPDAHGQWVHCASQLIPLVEGSQRHLWTARDVHTALAKASRQGAVPPLRGEGSGVRRGPSRALIGHDTLLMAPVVVAYCLGDAEALADLLSGVQQLGSRTRMGWGGVAAGSDGFVIERDELAHEAWQLRNMPGPIERFVPSTGRLHSPYWRAGRDSVWQPVDLVRELERLQERAIAPLPA